MTDEELGDFDALSRFQTGCEVGVYGPKILKLFICSNASIRQFVTVSLVILTLKYKLNKQNSIYIYITCIGR